jgi:hypothetical protein
MSLLCTSSLVSKHGPELSDESSILIDACTRVSSPVTEHFPFFSVLSQIFTEQVA